jgi:hypothetical protein
MLRLFGDMAGAWPAGAVAWVMLAAMFAPPPAHAEDLNTWHELRESVVRIEVEHPQGGRSGTGFLINDRRTFATNNHVVEGGTAFYVTYLAAGKPTSVPARVIAADPAKDMALVETLSDVFADPVVLANYDSGPPAKVMAVGYPVAANFVAGGLLPTILLEPSFSMGTISRIISDAKMLGGARLIQHTAAINPGNSGGPLFDDCGRVIGINTLRTPPKELDFPQGIFFAIDIRELQAMLSEQVVKANIVDKPCTPGLETKNDIPPATTREAEADMFDRFAACTKSRPCDRDICRGRYVRRVSTDLANARQADIDLRMSLSETRCTDQKETDAFAEFQSCAWRQPCEFKTTCGPKVEDALASASMRQRQTLFDRARVKAEADCKAAEAPGVWRGAETETGVWLAAVKNERGALLAIRCDVSGQQPGSGGLIIGQVPGNRDRWTGTRPVQMTIDSYSEPLRLEFRADAKDLAAGMKHFETADTRGRLKELIGKLSVGSVVTFEEPKVQLDETFTLGGAQPVLAPCFNAVFVQK